MHLLHLDSVSSFGYKSCSVPTIVNTTITNMKHLNKLVMKTSYF